LGSFKVQDSDSHAHSGLIWLGGINPDNLGYTPDFKAQLTVEFRRNAPSQAEALADFKGRAPPEVSTLAANVARQTLDDRRASATRGHHFDAHRKSESLPWHRPALRSALGFIHRLGLPLAVVN
jgi:hypothetical protein